MTLQEFQNRYDYNTATDELGKGGFGKVYKAYDRLGDRWVAIKVANVDKDRENLSLMNEVETAKKLPEHANIAQYESCYRFNSSFGVFDHAIIQYYEKGNLSQLIKNKQLSLAEKEEIAKGVIAGIAHLHRHNIVHRDIKSSNVLIAQRPDGSYNPKIADFGLSKEFTDTSKSYFSNSFAGGSLLYVAPEQLKGGQIRKNVDLWSMGVMFFELFTGKVPFYPTKDDGTETARKEVIQQIEKAILPSTINDIPTPWQTLIRRCLVVNSSDRLKDTKAAFAIINGGKPTIIQPTEPIVIADIPTVIDNTKEKDKPKHKRALTHKEFNYTPWIITIIIAIVLGVWIFNSGGEEEVLEPEAQEQEQEQEQAPEQEQAAQEQINNDNFEMVAIPSGGFLMGSNDGDDDEKPVHSVSVSSFSISKYEVTQAQWREIMGNNPSHFKGCDNCPVEKVSWNDIQDFLRKLNAQTGKRYRLPTEAEWEYAARGGQSYKYAGSDNIGNVAWYSGNSGNKTHPVGQKSANGYGLYDMSGNVYEWCQDTWYDNYSDAPNNGRAWTSGGNSARRVLRGGSWRRRSGYCRTTRRNYGTPSDRSNYDGFRLVLP